jgi:integrase
MWSPDLRRTQTAPTDGEFRTSTHKPLELAALAAGVDVRVTPQVLRRTFNTLMVHAGVDRIVLRSQMGHCSEEMTQRYAGVSVEAKLAAVHRLVDLTTATAAR